MSIFCDFFVKNGIYGQQVPVNNSWKKVFEKALTALYVEWEAMSSLSMNAAEIWLTTTRAEKVVIRGQV